MSVGRVVTLRCPAVEFEDISMPGTDMKALWSIREPELWVELTGANLDYLRIYMKHGLHQCAESQPERRRKNLRKAVAVAGSPKRRSRRRRGKASPNQEPAPVEDVVPEGVETVSDEESEVQAGSLPGDAELRDILDG